MGKLLDWHNMPPIGTKVVFKGYRTGLHDHWGFKVGKTYAIDKDCDGDIGPLDHKGEAPPENYNNDFIFELAEFTKSDLKDGMRLVDEDGEDFWVCGDCVANRYGSVYFEHISEDLINTNIGCKFIKVTDRDGTVLFEREEEPRELTIEEIAKAFNLPVERVRIKK